MKKIFITMILLLMVSSAFASDFTGKISRLTTGYQGRVYAKVDGNHIGASCSTHDSYHFAIDATIERNKIMYSSLLAAFMSNKTVELFGTGTCDTFPTIEDLSYMHILQ